MRKIWWLFCVLAAPAFAATYTVPAFTSASIQATVNTASGAGSGNTVLLPAGTYAISSTVSIPCTTNLTVTGPVTTPATAVLNATSSGYSIFSAGGGCTGITFAYLQFRNNSGIYFNGGSDNSGITITNSQFFSLPSTACPGALGSCKTNYTPGNSALFFDGYLGSSTAGGVLHQVTDNVNITNNVFGDVNSCTAVFGQHDDNGGTCAGITTHTGTVSNFNIKGNEFYHVEEPIHILQMNGNYAPPAIAGVGKAVHIEGNFFHAYMRIGVEVQVGAVSDSIYFQHNVVSEPYDPNYGSMGTSFACCQWGFNQGTGGYNPGLVFNDNIILNALKSSGPPIGVEFWGNGDQGTNSLIQGVFPNGYTWGFTVGAGNSWAIKNNYLCGTFSSGAITDQQHQGASYAPAQSGNVTGSTCSATTSIPPTVSPSSTASPTYPLAVTMTIPRSATSYNTGQNTSIYYTIDGSTPVPGQGNTKLYTGTVTLTGPATVKALSMWGTGPQPLSYPAGYGYVPSGTITNTYGAGGTAPSLSSLTIAVPQNSLTTASATETATVMCNYSNGSSYACGQSTDAYGFGPATFSSSNPSAATITAGPSSAGGVITPLAVGNTNVTASVGVLQSSPLPLTVSSVGGATATIAGNNLKDFTGYTYSGNFNMVYTVTPATGGPWTPGQCHFWILGTVQSGKHWDCLLISAPTPTTKASTPLCVGTYTTTSTVGPGQVDVTPTSCPTIANSTAVWAATITDDTTNPAGLGFYDCGGSCAGSAPGVGAGSGTYPGYWASNGYGTYTSMSSGFSGTNPRQPSVWFDLAPATGATLTGAYQSNQMNLSTMLTGQGIQMHAYCTYSDNVVQQCDTADARGDAVTAWSVTAPGSVPVLSIQNVGGTNPGLVTGVNYGQGNTTCTVNGSVACSPWTWRITNVPATADLYQGMTLKGMQVQ